jgi:hypothetical protein
MYRRDATRGESVDDGRSGAVDMLDNNTSHKAPHNDLISMRSIPPKRKLEFCNSYNFLLRVIYGNL